MSTGGLVLEQWLQTFVKSLEWPSTGPATVLEIVVPIAPYSSLQISLDEIVTTSIFYSVSHLA